MKKDLKKILMCLGLFLQTDLVAVRKKNSNKNSIHTKKVKNKSKKVVDSTVDGIQGLDSASGSMKVGVQGEEGAVDTMNGGIQGLDTVSDSMNVGIQGEKSAVDTMNGGIQGLDTVSDSMNVGIQGEGSAVDTMKAGVPLLEEDISQNNGLEIDQTTDTATISVTDEPINEKPYSTLVANKYAEVAEDKDSLKIRYDGAKHKLLIDARNFSEYAQNCQGPGAVQAMRKSGKEWKRYVKDTRKMIDCVQECLDYESQCTDKNKRLSFSVERDVLELEAELSKFKTKMMKRAGKEPEELNVLTEFGRYRHKNKAKPNTTLNVQNIERVSNNDTENNNSIKANEVEEAARVKQLPKQVEEKAPVKQFPKKVEEKAPTKPISKSSETQGNRKPLSTIDANQRKVSFEKVKMRDKVESEGDGNDLSAAQISVSLFANYINIAGYFTYGVYLDDYNTTFSGYLSPQVHGFAGGISILTSFWSISDAEEFTEETTFNWTNNIKVLLLVGCHNVGYKNLGLANFGLDFKIGLVYSLVNFFENEYLAGYNVGLVGGITGKACEFGLMIYAPKGLSIFVGYHHNR